VEVLILKTPERQEKCRNITSSP